MTQNKSPQDIVSIISSGSTNAQEAAMGKPDNWENKVRVAFLPDYCSTIEAVKKAAQTLDKSPIDQGNSEWQTSYQLLLGVFRELTGKQTSARTLKDQAGSLYRILLRLDPSMHESPADYCLALQDAIGYFRPDNQRRDTLSKKAGGIPPRSFEFGLCLGLVK